MLTTLVGSDTFAQAQRVRELVGYGEYVTIDGEDGLSPWFSQLGQGNLFGGVPTLVGRRLFEGLAAADRKALAAHLQQSGAVQSGQPVIVVVEQEVLPAKDGLAEVLRQGKVEEFPALTVGQVARWVQQEAQRLRITIDKTVVPELVTVFGGDRFALRSELEKWALRPDRTVDREMVGQAAAVRGDVEAFGLAETWGLRRVDEALKLLQQQWRQQAAPQALIALFERQARMLYVCLAAQEMEDGGRRMEEVLGVQGFVARKVANAAKKWEKDEVRLAIEGLYQLDLAIKTGKIEAQMGVEMWVVETVGMEVKS